MGVGFLYFAASMFLRICDPTSASGHSSMALGADLPLTSTGTSYFSKSIASFSGTFSLLSYLLEGAVEYFSTSIGQLLLQHEKRSLPGSHTR